ncbi:hypothetical protein TrST_g3800 [Triparma strigata]|uniref:Uncharacterized protein n=1 Tax=Triparma strigata TaxID=1606541 RepID=A0A9W7AHZ2_9STRA|nr:hypothetical protein TrST_g3800 [Triparma strigata]
MADTHVHPPPSIEGLQAELKAAVSALEAEREANKSLSAKLMEKEKAVAQFEGVVAQDKIRALSEGYDDLQRNLPKTTSELEEELKKSRERNSDLQQEVEFLRLQQATSTPLTSPSPPAASAGLPHDLQGGQDHPTTLHRTNADLRNEGKLGALNIDELRMELQTQKKLLKKVKDEAESEVAAALRREEAALRREEAALRREEAALRENAASEEERKKFTAVMSQLGEEGDTLQKKLRRLDGADTSSAHARPLDWSTPGVQKVGGNMLVKNTTTNTCVFSLVVHEVPEALLEALLGNQTKVGKMLFQKVLEEGVAYWIFMFEGTKSCELLLRMRVEKRDDEEGLLIRVESVDEEELGATSLPNPHSTASKKLRILLKQGTIFLQPLQFGQTLFTFTAQVDIVARALR